MSSWLGGGLSSLRGQLSLLINEDLPQDSDPVDELMVAKVKISDLENKLTSSSFDVKELTEKNNELKIKLQSEEIMLQRVSDSFKEKLKEKEQYIESLKEQICSTELGGYGGSLKDEAQSKEFFDFVNEPSSSTSELFLTKKSTLNDEAYSLRNQIYKLEQEVLRWRSIAESVKSYGEQDDRSAIEGSISELLETQRQDLELRHSNYVLELQQEHNKQVHFLKRQIQRSGRSSESEARDGSRYMFLDPSKEENIFSSSKDNLVSLLETIQAKVENEEVSVDLLLRKLQECEEVPTPRNASLEKCDIGCQYFMETATSDNSQRHISNCFVADSMSQISDVSQVSITTRLLDENVKSLSSRINEYGHQLTSIRDKSSDYDQNKDPEEITDKLQQLKMKISERKNTILEQNNQQLNIESVEVPLFGDSWENSSINSLVEESSAVEGVCVSDIKSRIKDIFQVLGEVDPDNDCGGTIMDCLGQVKDRIKEVVEASKCIKEDDEGLTRCMDLAISGDVDEDGRTDQKNEETLILSRNIDLLKNRIQDLESTITRYETLEKVCDSYEKELLDLKTGSSRKTNCGMDSDDILEHVKTFNEEKDECIEKLESRIISLQNLVEEKDDFMKAMKAHEVELIYEYDSSIGVLNCELENVRATLEKTYETEMEHKKELYRLNMLTREKDQMINSLNEELTMLSHQDDHDIQVQRTTFIKKVNEEEEEETTTDQWSQTVEGSLDDHDHHQKENQRLVEVIEAQATSLGLYEAKVTNLETEVQRLGSVIKKDDDENQEMDSEQMARETLHHLSQMIRDKEWEIEALKTKNESLCDIIKGYGTGSDCDVIVPIEKLLQEKEALSKEVVWYQENREQLVNALNVKHKESLNYHGEIQRLVAYINSEQTKWSDLCQENEVIKEKINQLLDQERSTNTGRTRDLVDTAVEFKEEDEEHHNRGLDTRLLCMEQQNQASLRQINALENELEKVSFELEQSRILVQELTESHGRCQTQIIHYQDELAKMCKLNVTSSQLTEKTKDIWNDEDKEDGAPQFGTHPSEGMDVEEQLRLLKIQFTDQIHQMNQVKAREMKLLKEKQILQDHLLRIEESYTQDATLAEDREQSLRKHLREVEDKLITAQDHIMDLEKKVATLTNTFHSQTLDIRSERDEYLQKLRISEAQLKETLQSLYNLQSVLDKIQQDQSTELSFQKEHLQQDLRMMREDRDKWKIQCQELQRSLQEQTEVVEAAQRLTDQMEEKDDQLAEMQASLSRKEEVVDNLKMEIRKLNSVTESKVDKVLMRNLIIGYFHTPLNKRQDALRVIGSLLQFSDKDYNQVGIDTANKSRWFSWLRPAGVDNSRDPDSGSLQEHSFSELFVRFLERESTPLPQVRLPTTQVIAEARKHSSLSYSDELPSYMMMNKAPIPDHHKFFTSSPMVTKRSLGEDRSAEVSSSQNVEETAPTLFISNLQEPKSQIHQQNPPLSHRRTDASKNALLSLLEQ